MENYLYLYSKPFIDIDKESNRQKYKLEYFGEFDRSDEEKIRALILKFAIEEQLVRVVSDNKISHSITQDMGSWEWLINWMNFRSLVDVNQYGKLMSSLQVRNEYPVNQIIDLHVRLGSLFDERVLNTIVNRIMHSITLIKYDTPSDATEIEWSKIHKETPFIWLIVFIQMVMKSAI